MTDITLFKPRLIATRPAAGSTNVSGSLIGLDVVDDDYPDDLHFGALDGGSLYLGVNSGDGRFEAIIRDGEVQRDSTGRRFAAIVVPRIALTGAELTGTFLTGRFRQRSSIRYIPSEFFPDGQEVGVRIRMRDVYGYELDETFYFTMHEWRNLEWPIFTIMTPDGIGPLSAIPFAWYSRGSIVDIPLTLKWGDEDSLPLSLDDALLRVGPTSANSQGKEVIENGYCLFVEYGDGDWQALSPGADIHLRRFASSEGRDIAVRLALPAEAATDGQMLFGVSIIPIRASLCGARLCGCETTGCYTGFLYERTNKAAYLYIYASVMSPGTEEYLRSHFLNPPGA
ncbi:MAG: hypothetical protein JW941_09335 [Candidatus Coatesbacteria bacterium]|nr:hypothetical protein [Candidatus Coatesbacteria bacterium]